MWIGFRDYRCFHQIGPLPIKPLTLLVGENSAGKSSFLAGLRFVLELTDEHTQASFNRNPFFLGAYEQIAHSRRGRLGRAQSFCFDLELEVKPNYRYYSRRRNRREEERTIRAKLSFSFENASSQPKLSHVNMSFGAYGAEITLSDAATVSITTPGAHSYTIPDDLGRRYLSVGSSDFNFVMLFVRDLHLMVGRSESGSGSDKMEEDLEYISAVAEGIRRILPRQIYASAPVRTEPERTYNPEEAVSTPEGKHIPFVLAQMRSFDPEAWKTLQGGLARFGKTSGLFETIDIRRFGKSESGPFQIIVGVTASQRNNLIDVGYGVSQALPLLVELLRSENRSMYLLQQPEVHLHPRGQAELATFFASAIQERHHTVVVETHSDYIIDRVRMDIRDKKGLNKEDVAVLYFERIGADVIVHELGFDETGNVVGAPASYRAFFLREEMRSVGIDET